MENMKFCPYPRCLARGFQCVACRAGKRDVWAEQARHNARRGRKPSEAIITAKLLGDKTYHGSECRACGATERYVSNSTCVACAKERGTEGTALRRAARAAGTRLAHENSARPVPASSNEANELDPSGTDAHHFSYPSHERKTESGIAKSVCQCAKGDDLAELLGESLHSPDVCQLNDAGEDFKRADIIGDGDDQDQDPALRYFCHPESGSLWSQAAGDPVPTDGLVEELTEAQYREGLDRQAGLG